MADTYTAAIDWRVIPASALILMALLILAALALACSTRLEVIPSPWRFARRCLCWGWFRIIFGGRARNTANGWPRCFMR